MIEGLASLATDYESWLLFAHVTSTNYTESGGVQRSTYKTKAKLKGGLKKQPVISYTEEYV